MLNKIILMGRLTHDPELRRTQNGTAVTGFSLAVERDFKDKDGNNRHSAEVVADNIYFGDSRKDTAAPAEPLPEELEEELPD